MNLISQDVYDETLSPPRLIAGRFVKDGRIVFPLPDGSSGEDVERIHLKREGKLWAYTVQRFPPGPPFVGVRDAAEFKPFAIGYVELENEIIVESHIVVDDFSLLSVGMPMTLTTTIIPGGDDREDVRMFAFKPVGPEKT